jgi:DNA (cytosine-5)-methyltransferase 1
MDHRTDVRKPEERSEKANKGGCSNLREQVHNRMWQTPNAMDSLPPRNEEALKKQYDKNRKGRTEHSTLREQVVYPKPNKMWPTPRSAIGMHMKLTENMEKLHHKKYLETEVAYTDKPRGGHLNPMWVEWLMGFPIGWTDLKD